jgi:hypothetical protein
MGNAESFKTLKPISKLISEIKKRPVKYKEADISCVKAIAQAAINVELFTIPLYMTALYSIQGTHQITSKNSDLYEGRWWPGAGATAPAMGNYDKLTSNEKVFNNVYSVFIEEMLHLQLASNMASTIGVTPCFTSTALQNDSYGWHCYSPETNNNTIPHILSFHDCNKTIDGIDPRLQPYFKSHYPGKSLQDMQVKLDAMNDTQALLFLAIEETEDDAHKLIQKKYWDTSAADFEPVDVGGKRPKYFEPAPYNWWQESYTEGNLPLFGSIGYMYQVYWHYLEIEYDDGSSLLNLLVNDVQSIQRDEFNTNKGSKQYPGIAAEINIAGTDIDKIKLQLINNINAITDQGEGDKVVGSILDTWGDQQWAKSYLKAQQFKLESNGVDEEFQPDPQSLTALYPGYNDKGIVDGVSGSAYARIYNRAKDHFETFEDCLQLILKNTASTTPKGERYVTWDVWHKENENTPWTAAMLNPNNTQSKYSLPSAEDVASALNNLGAAGKVSATHEIFSLSAVGTLKGLTTALDKYWNGDSSEFPGPAMGGSGDRVSICWATTGMTPDLITGIENPHKDNLYNACQGMDYMASSPVDVDMAKMPDVVTYHSCKGSNSCMAQGGCGFVQSDAGGGNCSQSVVKQSANTAGCGAPDIKSAPADNKCASFGGCAVPISASQLYPDQTESNPMMKLYSFEKSDDGYHSKDAKIMLSYEKGDGVYDIAWKAYCLTVGDGMRDNLDIKSEDVGDTTIVTATIKDKPNDTDIRLALPPST